MGRSIAAVLLLFALGAGACPKESALPARQNTGLPKARDGNIAIRQEFEAARRAGTIDAYDLFIARHPNHPLAQEARRNRDRIRKAVR